MTPAIDLSKEYGLVLEGGGAKGAYEIGAWKALRETGVKIRGISGTSVGALNGALICMGDLEKAEEVWKNITYSTVMDVDDEMMKQFFQMKMEPREFFKRTFKHIKEGGMDVSPLKKLLEEIIDVYDLQHSPYEFFVQTFNVDSMQEQEVDMKEIEPELVRDMLLASAYMFPVFKNEKLHGKTYIDAGIFDNVPVKSLLDREYKDLIVVRIHGIGRTKPVKIPEDVQVITIEPRGELGSVMDFDPEKSRKNMVMGYFDAMRAIYGMEGRAYYIVQTHDEEFYMHRLAAMKQEDVSLRKYMEKTLGRIAAELRMGNDWNYTSLYLTMLEAAARMLRVPKYKIYTVEELQIAVREYGFKEENLESFPLFAKMMIDG